MANSNLQCLLAFQLPWFAQILLFRSINTNEEDIKILNVTSGSIKVIIELPEHKKELLIDLFNSQSNQLKILLDEYNILEIIENEKDFLDDHIQIYNHLEYVVQKQKIYAILTVVNMNLNSIIAPDFKSLLVTLSNEGINNLILDVSNVKFIDSSGLSAILTANRLWRNSGNFVLVGAIHESVKKLFEISSLNTVVNIRRDVTDGIEFIIFENNDVEVEY